MEDYVYATFIPMKKEFKPQPNRMNGARSYEMKDGTPINEKLRQFYIVDDAGSCLNNLYQKEARCPGPVNAKIPRMRVARSASELIADSDVVRYGYLDFQNPIYDEFGMDIGYDSRSIPGGLKEYLVFTQPGKPPLYISDNHNHALFAWQEAREAGIITEGAVLVRFDDHLDMKRVAPKNISALTREVIREKISNDPLEGIDIENFTPFAIKDGLISQMLFVHGRTKNKDDKKVYEASPELREYLNTGKFDFVSPELEEGVEVLVARLRAMKEEGKSIIIDVDFDVFTKELSKEWMGRLEDAMQELAKIGDLITCATSPGYGNHAQNVERARSFIEKFLSPTQTKQPR